MTEKNENEDEEKSNKKVYITHSLFIYMDEIKI